jgi:Tol biopolymer transport system component
MRPIEVLTWIGRASQVMHVYGVVAMLAVVVLGCERQLSPLATEESPVAKVSRRPAGSEGTIVFARNERLFTINPDGSGLTQVATTICEGLEPAWSSDGRRIGFIHRCGPSGTFDLAMVNRDGSGLRALFATPTDDARIDFSPDDTRILFTSDVTGNRDIYVMDLGLGIGATRTRNLTRNAASDEWPAWSPDGRFIAFTSRRGGDFDVYRMDPDGNGVLNLTKHSANDGDADMGGPSWSPDGSRIAFDSDRGGGVQIFTMDPDGGNVAQLTSLADGFVNFAPAWSPDGQFIAFVSDRTFNRELWIMEANGDNQTQLTFLPGVDERPDWYRPTHETDSPRGHRAPN